MSDIILTIMAGAKFFDVDFDALTSTNRKREIVLARHMIMHYLYATRRYSLSFIGKHFCRDHTTVIHAKQTINDLLFTDRESKVIYANMSMYLTVEGFKFK